MVSAAALASVFLLAGSGSDVAGQRLVSILQYLEADYPLAVASGDALEMEEQRAFAKEALEVLSEVGPSGEPFRGRLEHLAAEIGKGAPPPSVSTACAELALDVVKALGLARGPRHPPDLEKGRALYVTACAACHGAAGDGQSVLSPTLEPRPTNFLGPVMDDLSPFRAYNALTFGIPGTSMPDYSVLEEDDRWSLAFFLFTFRQPPCPKERKDATLELLSSSSDRALGERFGSEALACLRQKPPALDEERSLLLARAEVERAIVLAREAHFEKARAALIDGYLNGLEPVEPRLKLKNPELLRKLEGDFQRLRRAVEEKRADLRPEGPRLLSLLDQAREQGGRGLDFWSAFSLSGLILLREGFEALVVIAALLAILKKSGQDSHRRVVHAGWMLAVVVGAAAYLLGRGLLAGAEREWIEGVVGLVAVVLLVYAALWLNSRSGIRKLMGKLRDRMGEAASQGSWVALFLVSFSAMLRESLETAVFLQGLATDSPSGTAWGASSGFLLLLLLAALIAQVGYRLPMKALFSASTVLLVATAVVLLGKSLRALQETGTLPLRPMSFVEVPLLGIYPDWVTLLPQLLLAAAPLVLFLPRLRATLERPT